MQPIHTTFLVDDHIATMRREADAHRRAAAHRDDRDPQPQPQPWPRLFLSWANRIIIEPMRVELR
jgi:hypothetical protein